jgi:aspartyl-tRNA(Asn)/glutamyl-tRNA(Gln) amidotransferase subunit B
MRCDVNVSLMPRGASEWGTRTETKNVNSLRSVERSVRSEIERQAGVLDAGGRIVQETRHFQESTGSTTSGRSKEEAQDYRYFPEPDLVPMAPSPEWVRELKENLPELPAAMRVRVKDEWNLTDSELRDIVNAGALDLIAATVRAGASAAEARKWWMNELSRYATEKGVELAELPVTPGDIVELASLIAQGAINDKIARQVLGGVLAGEGSPSEVVEKRGLKVVSDEGELTAVIDQVIAENPEVADKIRAGKVAAAGALVGAVMKATRGQADAGRARELIVERLS